MFNLNPTIQSVLEITFVAVLVFLVLKNNAAFSDIVKSVSDVYVKSVKALQGQ